MIHTLKDYKDQDDNKRGGPQFKVTPKVNTNKFNHNHKSLGKYNIPKTNNNPSSNFHAFKGRGRAVSQINTNGLKVNKFVTNQIDKKKPTCKIDIRLFNGTVVTANFNLNQTIREIKNFVERKSGSHNFSLLEGFPPKPLTELNKTIEQLGLKDCMLTQKVK